MAFVALTRGYAVANEEHLAILMQGVSVWNEWRADARTSSTLERGLTAAKRHGGLAPDLTGAKLEGWELDSVDFETCQLNGALLARANLKEATLFRSLLTGADLRAANLQRANMRVVERHGPTSVIRKP